jgi:hypothetical protein
MKRDWELVRTILIKLEELPPLGQLDAATVAGYEDGLVAAHMQMMNERGLINGINVETSSAIDYIGLGLTWEGADLLDKIRADTVWGKVKQQARDKGVGLSLDVVKALAKLAIENLLGVELGR